MPKPLPIELRRRAIDVIDMGAGTYQEVAERFSVHMCTVYRWNQLDKLTNDLSPKPIGGFHGDLKIPDGQLPLVQALVAEKSDRTVTELMTEWNRRYNSNVSRATMGRALLRANLPYKKNFSRH